MEGKVIEEVKYGKSHPRAGEVSGINVQIEKEGSQFVGFIPCGQLKKEKGGELKIPKVNQIIKVKIEKTPDLDNLDLILTQREVEGS